MEKREKILIIDDSSVQADMLRSILENDYDITVAHTAEATTPGWEIFPPCCWISSCRGWTVST